MNKQLHAIVHGRVQGVSFRYYTLIMAQQLKLAGWVRNLPDGTVETVAEGDETALNEFERFLHKGSPASAVSELYVDWQAASGDFDSFDIR
jgi:acylphosphatase